ncbi:hypothetical protein MHYP_G00197910 [Metynnis hypsauchen]
MFQKNDEQEELQREIARTGKSSYSSEMEHSWSMACGSHSSCLVVCLVHVGGQTFGFVAALLCWLWYSGASRLCSPMVLWDQVLDTLTVPVPGSGPADVFSFMAQGQCGVGS